MIKSFKLQSISYPLGVSDAAVVAVVSLEVWVLSVPLGVCVTLWSGLGQKAVGPVQGNVNVTHRHHLCLKKGKNFST